MAKNLVAQVGKAGGEFELVEREIPQPGAGEIRIKVEACGICHSDMVVTAGRISRADISASAGT